MSELEIYLVIQFGPLIVLSFRSHNFSLVCCAGTYRPKALPSAGVLPFMQTVVCDLEDKPVSLDSWLNGSGAFPDMYPDAK